MGSPVRNGRNLASELGHSAYSRCNQVRAGESADSWGGPGGGPGLVMAWRAGRRRQLVVAELINSTGHSDLDGVMRGLTQLAASGSTPSCVSSRNAASCYTILFMALETGG